MKIQHNRKVNWFSEEDRFSISLNCIFSESILINARKTKAKLCLKSKVLRLITLKLNKRKLKNLFFNFM